ncbi:MAG: Asp-tRNA(Asn)/Glu-tRNA(Gln) amidotransferase subunit GatC [Arenicella sp.]|jgi:aspartyl-tRNA(Asn)/glutamyl-tRNA(Gln) amidotransferase subunit C|nr:Asp-tRNA(Asn)/Glu-tRNA(Gln) amidotransferase subunit GatC [Arenicella sp.]HAU66763.1 Asp-tRNA(Asn)/Glu-tRNA(Gln) amidotransferase GatCAB subunit C [Gammaproteobacteria bacterium]
MPLDQATVKHIAHLAKLEIEEKDLPLVADELSNILALVAQMDAADTDGIEPMTHPFDATLRLRDDVVTAVDSREKLQTNAPDTEQGLFLVPKVMD